MGTVAWGRNRPSNGGDLDQARVGGGEELWAELRCVSEEIWTEFRKRWNVGRGG